MGGDSASGHPLDADRLASREPGLDLTVDGDSLRLTTRNIAQVQLDYYLIDLELLFSRNPFGAEQHQLTTLVEPNRSERVPIDALNPTVTIAFPADLAGRHVYVEASAAGKSIGQFRFANRLHVVISERYGQIVVRDRATGDPLPRTYIKVYGQTADGLVEFYKDGYTDLRGKFDYGSLSGDQLSRTRRFAILALSDTHGAIVRDVGRP
jgi:hypothetical protein